MEHVERANMEVDVVCVGFGPAAAGFLYTLSKKVCDENGNIVLKSRVSEGAPLQVLCYERADDLSFGVSGVVSKARAIKESLSANELSEIPLLSEVSNEKLVYLLDPHNASRRPLPMKIFDGCLKAVKHIPFLYSNFAFTSPVIPPFMNKHGGYVFSIGQFLNFMAGKVMGTGAVQLWPSTPAAEPLMEGTEVKGVRLIDQGTDKSGNPDSGNYMPGMDIKARLTVVADGPVGTISQQLDEKLGVPEGHEVKDYAVGMKMLVELAPGKKFEKGTVIHTLGYPEPEMFGFLYALEENLVSIGIFVPSWYDNPVRTAYRYLQHYITHPYFYEKLEGGNMRSWGAKTIQEAGKRGEPFLVADGMARIGENSGTTNLLYNSGVDEAFMSGVLLANAVETLCKEDKPFTKENLSSTYEKARRESMLEREAKLATKARDGFQHGVIQGLIGNSLTWLTGGLLSWPAKAKATHERIPPLDAYLKATAGFSEEEIKNLKLEATAKGVPLYDAVMNRLGWPTINHDGKLLVSHQDALLVGGKVQAPARYRDHVVFKDQKLCERCETKLCIEMCSGQAIAYGENGLPKFDREKCIHCGGCLWNCTMALGEDKEKTNLEFIAGTGGLHSAEN